MKCLTLIVADPSLQADASGWRDLLKSELAHVERGDLVLTGGECDAEAWCVTHTRKIEGVRVVEFRPGGQRWHDGRTTGTTWHDTDRFVEDWRFERVKKQIEAAEKVRAAGWSARFLVIRGADESPLVQKVCAVLERAGYMTRIAVHDSVVEIPDDTRDSGVYERPTIVEDSVPYARLPIVWCDTETTGTTTYDHHVTEIGAILVDPSNRRELDRFDERIELDRDWFGVREALSDASFVSPGAYKVREALRIGNYSPARWSDAQPHRDVLRRFHSWLPSRFRLANHNASFDKRMLAAAFEDAGVPVPGWHKDLIDTLYTARKVLRKSNKVTDCRLDTLCDYLGISNTGQHTAMADAERAWAVSRALVSLGVAA